MLTFHQLTSSHNPTIKNLNSNLICIPTQQVHSQRGKHFGVASYDSQLHQKTASLKLLKWAKWLTQKRELHSGSFFPALSPQNAFLNLRETFPCWNEHSTRKRIKPQRHWHWESVDFGPSRKNTQNSIVVVQNYAIIILFSHAKADLVLLPPNECYFSFLFVVCSRFYIYSCTRSFFSLR